MSIAKQLYQSLIEVLKDETGALKLVGISHQNNGQLWQAENGSFFHVFTEFDGYSPAHFEDPLHRNKMGITRMTTDRYGNEILDGIKNDPFY